MKRGGFRLVSWAALWLPVISISISILVIVFILKPGRPGILVVPERPVYCFYQ